jgi:hypothetical protein
MLKGKHIPATGMVAHCHIASLKQRSSHRQTSRYPSIGQ